MSTERRHEPHLVSCRYRKPGTLFLLDNAGRRKILRSPTFYSPGFPTSRSLSRGTTMVEAVAGEEETKFQKKKRTEAMTRQEQQRAARKRALIKGSSGASGWAPRGGPSRLLLTLLSLMWLMRRRLRMSVSVRPRGRSFASGSCRGARRLSSTTPRTARRRRIGRRGS